MPQAANLSTPLAYALAYAAMGWHVLPLVPQDKRPLGTLVRRGMLDATTDPEVIRGWWQEAPEAGVGISLAASGLMAIDVDPRNGGADTFQDIQAAHGSLISNVMAFTGGGGEHHVFGLPPGGGFTLPGLLGPGVDVKVNGYIVVEPSIHPSGKRYEWEASSSPLDGVAPSPLPDWLRSLRVELRQPESHGAPVDARQARDVREALYLLDADEYDTWVRAGMALHATGWGHPAFAIWCAWAQQSDKFDSHVSREKWASFTAERAGGLTLAWVFAQAQAKGWVNPASRIREATPADEPPPARHPSEERAAAADGDLLPFLNLAQLQETAASVKWLVKHVVPAESLGIMFGGSGTFKSFVALDMALHVAHGMKWLGRKTRQGPVIIVAAEGGAGLWRRIQAWHREHGLEWDKAPVYVVPVSVDLANDAWRVREAAQAAVVTPQLVVVDTLSQTFTGEENSAPEVSNYLRALGLEFRMVWQCAVLVIHHTGHQTTERPRGSSALRANVDFMFGVFRDEKEMLATLECSKQKDGELFEPVSFSLTVKELENDEDGEPVTTLVAHRVVNSDEMLELMRREAVKGRGGRNQLFLQLIQNGMQERELRKVFYDNLDGTDPEAKKKAFARSRGWAITNGFVEISEGTVIVLKELH